MIITNDILNNKPPKNIKVFKDTTCLVNLVTTEDTLGVVCYFFDELGAWHPFYVSKTKKSKFKAKTYADLICDLPKLNTEYVSDARGKFYNTFDTPIEVNIRPFATVYDINNEGKVSIFERKTYYLITDVQELERTFNSTILPCEIINFNNVNDLFNNQPIHDSVKTVVSNILNNL